jgi:Calpain family cysteine protease
MGNDCCANIKAKASGDYHSIERRGNDDGEERDGLQAALPDASVSVDRSVAKPKLDRVDENPVKKPTIVDERDVGTYKGIVDKENSEVERRVDQIIAAGKPFMDPDFPPNSSSLGPVKVQDVEWARASEIFKSPAIFKDGIEPNDIQQGALGDCYFLAVLSSMAEDPRDVKALFYT